MTKREAQELQVVSIKKNGEDVTVSGLPDHILRGISEDDPAVVFDWDHANLHATTVTINAAGAAAGGIPPPWVGAAYPITELQLQHAILARVQAAAGAGGVIGNSIIAPNSTQQYANVKVQLNNLGLDPFFAGATVPIAKIYVIMDGKKAVTGVADPVAAPPAPGIALVQKSRDNRDERKQTLGPVQRLRLGLLCMGAFPVQCYGLSGFSTTGAFPSSG